MSFWDNQSLNQAKRIQPKGGVVTKAHAATPAPRGLNWRTMDETDAEEIARFLSEHYGMFMVSISVVRWALLKRTVAVALVSEDKGMVAFALCMVCPMTLDGIVFERTFFGNYLCVHKDFRQKGIAGLIIGECFRRNREMGYMTGVMTRVNFDEPQRALPVAVKKLYRCNLLALGPEITAMKTIPFSPDAHSHLLSEWLMSSSKYHVSCTWTPEEVRRWFEGYKNAFQLRMCVDENGKPVSAFAFAVRESKRTKQKIAVGYFHVGTQLVRTFGTALKIAKLLGSTSYLYWHRRKSDRLFLRAHRAVQIESQQLSVYTFGCSAGRGATKNCSVDLFVW